MNTQPPIGVMPQWLWREKNPSPDFEERVVRIVRIGCACARYMIQGWTPLKVWFYGKPAQDAPFFLERLFDDKQ